MRGSSVRGVGTEETAQEIRCMRFFDLIQKQAKREGCIFFADSGEGRDIVTDELDGEDVSGWLIPEQDADAFEEQWRVSFSNEAIEERFDKLFVFARWEQTPEGITIRFT